MIIIILLLFIILTILLVYFSKLKIEICDLKKVKNKIIKNYLIYIKIYILNIKYFSYKIDKTKIEKLKKSKRITKMLEDKFFIDYKNQLKLLLKNNNQIKKTLKKVKAEIESLNLKMELGSENPIIASFKIAIISSQISTILLKTVKKKNYRNINYKILPIYNSENNLNIELNCIISVKIGHIIKVIKSFIKRSGLKNGTTSNRRTYDDCYGQH